MINKFMAFMELEGSSPGCQGPAHVRVLRQMSTVHTLSSHFSKTHVNITPPASAP